MSDELQISEDGHYLWDGADWISVEHVQLSVVGHLAGAQLSPDDNFWWNHVAQQWQRVADASPSSTPPAEPPAHHNPVTTTTSELEEPPSAEDMTWGREALDDALMSIVPLANEAAEKVVKLGGLPEEVTKVLEKAGEGVHALEMVGLEGELVFGGAAAAAIIVPFAMWYESLEGNNARNISFVRWRIFDPWMHGFIGALYGTATGGVDYELFTGWKEQGASFIGGMDDTGKRAVTGALIASFVYNSSAKDVVGQRLTHEQWDQRLNWTHAFEGLKYVLSAHEN
jgi:hypothetical protein